MSCGLEAHHREVYMAHMTNYTAGLISVLVAVVLGEERTKAESCDEVTEWKLHMNIQCLLITPSARVL